LWFGPINLKPGSGVNAEPDVAVVDGMSAVKLWLIMRA
jgi:hypothetical protein